MDIQAAVLREQGGPFAIETLSIDEPRDDEVLVRIVATGICHTDQEVVLGHMPPAPPAVLGHEGAGVVERVGAGVSHVRPGDHVILSFPSCGHCEHCDAGEPVLCAEVIPLAISGTRSDGSAILRDRSGSPVNSAFFGQSSFANFVIARYPNVVPIRRDAPLELLAPLGCGIQTGAGTVLNRLRPKPGSSIAVFGAGAVGLAAVMAAKISECSRIVSVDVNARRLELARELGATETVNVSGLSDEDVVRAVGEVENSIDASGNGQAINAAVAVLKMHGTCALLGVSKPGTRINVDHGYLLNSRTIVGVMQGDANPQTFIPQMVELFVAGKLPVDRLIKSFDLSDINAAFAASASGEVIKPVLRMSGPH